MSTVEFKSREYNPGAGPTHQRLSAERTRQSMDVQELPSDFKRYPTVRLHVDLHIHVYTLFGVSLVIFQADMKGKVSFNIIGHIYLNVNVFEIHVRNFNDKCNGICDVKRHWWENFQESKSAVKNKYLKL